MRHLSGGASVPLLLSRGTVRHPLTQACKVWVYVRRRESVEVALKEGEQMKKFEFCLDFLQIFDNLPRNGDMGGFLTSCTNMGPN